ncbi:hypothetical protein [Saccharothrix sp. ST-888]|uniref:hypothetical protein n=1 Tax=Saccharothrix sp. ST-888 TaxID=1427391 RepID=UPI0005EC12B1|nr:hypothetical protein [Saccharothrix sp. ST-888]KJK56042.1 hypothetical protein UK12_24985 [Saccharothrix sp. ST-888]
MPHRPFRVLCCALLALATGCTTVTPSADRVAAQPLTADRLKAAAVTGADLGPGYTVTVMAPGRETGQGADRRTSDVAACQPVLDAVGPGDPVSGPAAETDLDVAVAANPKGSVYTGLLAFRPGRAADVQTELDRVLAQCGTFTSTGQSAGAPGRRGGVVRTRHRLARLDTPTPEGADGATAFTLTDESGPDPLAQRALMARTGTVLAVFTTVGTGKDPAPAPDDRLVRTQVAKLHKAQQP